MEQLVKEIQETFTTFLSDALKEGNKAAGVRARKASLKLERQMKEFRKVSLSKNVEG